MDTSQMMTRSATSISEVEDTSDAHYQRLHARYERREKEENKAYEKRERRKEIIGKNKMKKNDSKGNENPNMRDIRGGFKNLLNC